MSILKKDSELFDNSEFKQVLNNQKFKELFECAESLNKEHCINENTKLIIVGTITPPKGMENGYFYTAPDNNIYDYIDEALGINMFSELKTKLKNSDEKGSVIEEIKKELKRYNIAFLDVVKNAIRVRGSSSDQDISYYSLDNDSFEKIFKIIRDDTFFICNSRMAENGYKKICKDSEPKRVANYKYIAQYLRAGAEKKEKNEKDWIETIQKVLGIK